MKISDRAASKSELIKMLKERTNDGRVFAKLQYLNKRVFDATECYLETNTPDNKCENPQQVWMWLVKQDIEFVVRIALSADYLRFAPLARMCFDVLHAKMNAVSIGSLKYT
jgi:hypothetical protein